MKESMKLISDQELLSQYEIVIVRPGGNDTAFVKGIYKKATRKRINDAIMRVYRNVEQVGFISTDGDLPELMMAGGEFCGNATRAFAWLLLKGMPGEVMLKVSGADQPVKAGIDENGMAYALIPVGVDKKATTRIDETTTMVNLGGIIHLVVKVGAPLSLTMQVQDIKAVAMYMLDKLKLRKKVPAAGVMFVSEYEDGFYMEPVVWVRDVKTLFYETACGSGTAATGLASSAETQDKEIKVTQPSGLPIWVQATSQFTKIKGPVSYSN